VETPIIVPPWSTFAGAGAGLSGDAAPSNVFLKADATAGAAGAAGMAGAGFAAPNADAAPGCGAGFANAEPAAPSDGAGAAGLGGAGDAGDSNGITLPSLAIMKLVLHFGQRIFMPATGMRRSSTSYGDLHDTHSTLIMDARTALSTPRFLRGALRRDETPNGYTLHGLSNSRDSRA
jgi:hypothetical protein